VLPNRSGFLILGGLLTGLLPLTLDVYLPGFPSMADDFGTDIAQLQLTVSTSLLGFALGQVIWGPIADRFGRKGPILIGLTIFTLASLGCAAAPSLGWLAVLRFVQAVGACAAVVGGRAMARDRYQGRELASALAIIFLIFGIAPAISPIIGTLLLATWEWPSTFIALAITGAIAFAWMAFQRETLPRDRRQRRTAGDTARGFAIVLREPVTARAAGVTFLAGAALFAWVAVSPAMLIGDGGLSLPGFTVVFVIVAFAQVIGAQANAMLLRRFDVHRLLGRLVTAMGCGGILLLAATVIGLPLWARVVLITLTIAPIVAVFGNAMTIAVEPFAALAGVVAGVVGALQTIGGSASAAILAALPVSSTLAMALGICIPLVVALPIAHSLARGQATGADRSQPPG